MENPQRILTAAVMAIKRGAREQGEAMLREVVAVDPRNEEAWLWLSAAVLTRDEKIRCLRQVLAINPNSQVARRGLQELDRLANPSPLADGAALGGPFQWSMPAQPAGGSKTISHSSEPVPAAESTATPGPMDLREVLAGSIERASQSVADASYPGRQRVLLIMATGLMALLVVAGGAAMVLEGKAPHAVAAILTPQPTATKTLTPALTRTPTPWPTPTMLPTRLHNIRAVLTPTPSPFLLHPARAYVLQQSDVPLGYDRQLSPDPSPLDPGINSFTVEYTNHFQLYLGIYRIGSSVSLFADERQARVAFDELVGAEGTLAKTGWIQVSEPNLGDRTVLLATTVKVPKSQDDFIAYAVLTRYRNTLSVTTTYTLSSLARDADALRYGEIVVNRMMAELGRIPWQAPAP